MFQLTMCVAVKRNGRDCTGPIVEDCPIPLCALHLRMAYLFYADNLETATVITAEMREDAKRLPERITYPTKDAKTSVVYYVAIGNHVKIGTTRDMASRMSTLQPDDILATEPGGKTLEQERHCQFARFRSKGREYFDPAPELMEHIERLRAHRPEPVRQFAGPVPGHVNGRCCPNPSCGLKLLVRKPRTATRPVWTAERS